MVYASAIARTALFIGLIVVPALIVVGTVLTFLLAATGKRLPRRFGKVPLYFLSMLSWLVAVALLLLAVAVMSE